MPACIVPILRVDFFPLIPSLDYQQTPNRHRLARIFLSGMLLLILQACSSKPKPEILTFDEWTGHLAGQRGHVVVVAVWATWCPSCVDTLTAATQIAQRYTEQGVIITSICLNDSRRKPEIEAAKKIIETQPEGTQHFLLRQDLGASLDSLSINDIPAVFVVDAKGEIRYRLEADDESNQISLVDLEDAIESVL